MKLFSHGVLGMNARNLKYIRKKNQGDSVSLADSKMKTKMFLSERGIPFAETYAQICTHQELSSFDFSSIPVDAFVIKPNHGSKWQGILIVKRNKQKKYIISGSEWSEDEIRLYMRDIISGEFSLYGNHDSCIIEELLVPGKFFSKYSRYWLADIRIIVYNYVPITAMIRMPTALSGGKANLAQGGIWLGLNIASGEVISFYQHKRNYTDIFPSPWEFLKGTRVSYWDKVLLHSSQIQFHTGLWYLALDWVITKNWPKLLEINARAGLEIQNVNLVPLAKRLEQVDVLKIKSPEKWVEIAKSLFHTEANTDLIGKKTIHSEQKIMFRGWLVTVKVDLFCQKTRISPDLKKKILKNSTLIFPNGDQIMLHPSEDLLSIHDKATIILGWEDLEDCIIIPKKLENTLVTTSAKFSDALISLDSRIFELSKKLNIASYIRPTNYTTELEKFLESPTSYNPVFDYNFPSPQKWEDINNLLREAHYEIESFRGNEKEQIILTLFRDKIQEIESRKKLILAFQNNDYQGIAEANRELYGEFDGEMLELSTKKILENAINPHDKSNWDLGRVLNIEEIMEIIEQYLKDENIEKVSIKISPNALSRMSISYKKSGVSINISDNASIYEHEIQALLSHELGTHLKRYQASKKLGLSIFSIGTAYYLTDEEWLAIYNSLEYLPEWYEKNDMYFKYYILSQADTLSFTQTAALIQSIYPHKKLESIFNRTLRLKRWIRYTQTEGIPWTTYQKDKIYVDGYKKIHDWIEAWWNKELLNTGKIKISDISTIQTILN